MPGYGVHLNSMIGEGELVRDVLDPGSADGLDDVAARRPGRRPTARRRRGRRRWAVASARALVQTLWVLRGTAPQEAVDAAA